MKKENIFRMSETADFEIKDVVVLNVLICYLLKKISGTVEKEQLYEIAVSTGIVNYFSYNDSMYYLLENGHIKEVREDGKDLYVLTRKGEICAEKLRDYVSKSCRDRLVLSAIKYFVKQKYEQEVKIDYIPAENGGYYTHVRCEDKTADLMDLKLFAPDLTQAKFLGEKIMLNPVDFYGKIMKLVLSNKEDEYDLTDN